MQEDSQDNSAGTWYLVIRSLNCLLLLPLATSFTLKCWPDTFSLQFPYDKSLNTFFFFLHSYFILPCCVSVKANEKFFMLNLQLTPCAVSSLDTSLFVTVFPRTSPRCMLLEDLGRVQGAAMKMVVPVGHPQGVMACGCFLATHGARPACSSWAIARHCRQRMCGSSHHGLTSEIIMTLQERLIYRLSCQYAVG